VELLVSALGSAGAAVAGLFIGMKAGLLVSSLSAVTVSFDPFPAIMSI